MAASYFRTRETAVALAAVAGLLLVAYVLVPHWSTRYGAWLSIFAIWMWWFVAVGQRWLADADF